MLSIFKNFPITHDEYKLLEKKFGQLCYYASWQLARKNSSNNHQCDIEDFCQELMFSVLRAGSYYKRQVYIDSSLQALSNSNLPIFTKLLLTELADLWANRTRHGANRQKFGDYQEEILQGLCQKYLPADKIPSTQKPLQFETKFSTYCKQIIWNAQRNLGKKITREKPLRSGQVSLSDHDYLMICE
jgi:hypothetical protein